MAVQGDCKVCKISELQVDWRNIEFGDVLVVSDHLEFGWVNFDSPARFTVLKIAEGAAQIVVEDPCHLGKGCVKNGALWNT